MKKIIIHSKTKIPSNSFNSPKDSLKKDSPKKDNSSDDEEE